MGESQNSQGRHFASGVLQMYSSYFGYSAALKIEYG
jgi:hypothetical protein